MPASQKRSCIFGMRKEEIEAFLSSLYSKLLEYKKEIKDLDLYAGKLGLALFFFYYSKSQKSHPKEDKILIEEILDDLTALEIQTIEGLILYSHLGLTLQTLINEDHSKFNKYATLLPEIDKLLCPPMEYWINELNFDSLRGSTNIALYYWLRNKSKYVACYIDGLYHRIDEYLNKSSNLNFGVAHGVCGILLFLINFPYVSEIPQREKMREICRKSVNVLFECNQPAKRDLSYFKKDKNAPAYTSKLGWCQGDLSITYMMHKLCDLLPEMIAPETLDYITDRTLARSRREIVPDYCLCHGASGISLLYYLQYKDTKRDAYGSESMHWLKRAMELYRCGEENPLYKQYGLGVGMLLGEVGLGLYLLLLLNPKYNKWMNLLLLK